MSWPRVPTHFDYDDREASQDYFDEDTAWETRRDDHTKEGDHLE